MSGWRSRSGAGNSHPDARADPPWRLALPTALLLLALATLFVSGGERGQFYRDTQHNQISSHHLALAANMSAEHNFLGFFYRTLDERGNPAHGGLYNRFPIGGYLLIKLAILPFQDDLSAQIHAARLLMLAFFAAAAVMAYLSLRRLVSLPWVALAATCLSFSSFYCLYNSDLVVPQAAPDLFAMLLAFHGMVVFMQDGRLRQLLVKCCLPLLLGWHVFAVLLPFVALGLATGLSRKAPGAGAPTTMRNRCLLLGVVTACFGLAVLGTNLTNEYLALSAEAATDLPSFRSILRRFGLAGHVNPYWADHVSWQPYLAAQLFRIASMFVPYCLTGFAEWMAPDGAWRVALGAILGAAALLACLAGLASLRWKLLWATLALSGLCWSLPLRHQVVAHLFESIFYVGLPLLFYSLVLLHVHRRFDGRAVVGLSIVAWSVFVLSGAQMAQRGSDAETAKLHRDTLADFERMRGTTAGKVVVVPPGWAVVPAFQMAYFYLAGATILFGYDTAGRTLADFVITPERDEETPSLTPENRLMFLYRRADLGKRQPISKRAGGALLRNEYGAVYVHDNALYYERRVAARISRQAPVVGDPFRVRLSTLLGRHARPKPWQWQASGDGRHWNDVARGSRHNRRYVPTAADVGWRLRARLDYLNSEGEWAKAVSQPSLPVLARGAGAGPRFPPARLLLHVIPVDAGDLREDGRRRGFDRLDSNLNWHGIPHPTSGQALVMRRLPEYPIAAIRIGETIPGEGVLWSAEIELRDAPK